MNNKSEPTYKTIGEVTKLLNLIDKKTGKPQTHTIRYWEKQFRQIKPVIMAGNRRYYSEKNINTIKLIMNLLKNQGMTIKGVKKILENKKTNKLDDDAYFGQYTENLNKPDVIKKKAEKVLKIIKELKNLK